MPTNTNILMVRHAEKPPTPPVTTPPTPPPTGLAVAGQERAQAYVIYFPNYSLNGAKPTFDFLFASANSSESTRPVDTITLLSNVLNLPINQNYTDKEFKELAHEIRHDPQYDQKTILICWHHGEILDLASHLLHGTSLPKASNWPTKWPGDVFGWVLQLCYDSSGHINPSQTLCASQKLMFDDHGQEPPGS